MRTYNQVVGSMRMESSRVSSESCPYKSSGWTKHIFGSLRPTLWDSEGNQPCYGASADGLENSPFGPDHDPSKWSSVSRFDISTATQIPVYKVDLGKDPQFALYKLEEMRRDGFLSKNTRRVYISMTVYNNALPMLCSVRLIFEMSSTGELDKFFSIEPMNPMPYMKSTFWLQAMLEILFILVSLSHAFLEVYQMRSAIRNHGWLTGLYKYFTDFWNALDWASIFLAVLFCIYWVRLLVDNSRDIDLDTQAFVDLTYVSALYSTYNLLFNFILLFSLFSLLRYTELDNRMALLTRSLSESLSDLGPFMILFFTFLFVFAAVGHLLYGPVLVEWSTPWDSIVTAIDIMMGNYVYSALKLGVPKDDPTQNVVAALFFYVYFFLMMLITLNIVIAILMDGYASVKERHGSEVEERLSRNVGSLWGVLTEHRNKSKRMSPLGHTEWKDWKWSELLNAVIRRRKLVKMRPAYYGRISELMVDLRGLEGMVKLTPEELKDMSWQVKVKFQDRKFISPPDISRPDNEPKVEEKVDTIAKDLRALVRPIRGLVQDLHYETFAQKKAAAKSFQNLAESSPLPQQAPATSLQAPTTSPDIPVDAQQLWKQVQSQHASMLRLIDEQQQTIARLAQQAAGRPTPKGKSLTEVDALPVGKVHTTTAVKITKADDAQIETTTNSFV
jgi:hypothetical protein